MLKIDLVCGGGVPLIYSISMISSGVLVGHMFFCKICGNLRVAGMHDEEPGRCTCSCDGIRPLNEQLERLQLRLDLDRSEKPVQTF